TRRSQNSCAYRGRASPTKCARSISGECLANDCDRLNYNDDHKRFMGWPLWVRCRNLEIRVRIQLDWRRGSPPPDHPVKTGACRKQAKYSRKYRPLSLYFCPGSADNTREDPAAKPGVSSGAKDRRGSRCSSSEGWGRSPGKNSPLGFLSPQRVLLN